MACLLVVASALSLASGTALAQGDPPEVISSSIDGNRITLTFDKERGGDLTNPSVLPNPFFIRIDGVEYDFLNYQWPDGHFGRAEYSGDRLSLTLLLGRRNANANSVVLTADQTVVVSYVRERALNPHERLVGASGNQVENFIWDVNGNRALTTEGAVYAQLGSYFSGTQTLAQTAAAIGPFYNAMKNRIVGGNYPEALESILAAGGLSNLFRIGHSDEPQTAWGKPGTENWGQVGFPWGFPREICLEADSHGTCTKSINTIEAWGWGSQYQCGGRNMPGFSGGDHTNFFWACTSQGSQGQWVPVKRHRPGVDYSPDHELKRPGTAEYNNDCLYRDEQGNPAPVFRADFHPQDHPNPQLRGKPIRRPDGSIQGTTIHGGNWDPLAKQCTTRGNR